MARNQRRWLDEFTGEPGKRLLRCLAARLVDAQQADDLAQETYLRLLRVDEEAVIREPRAYALRVAANVAHEWRSLARNRLPHGSEALEVLEDESSPERACEQRQRIDRLNRALETLSPNCRAVLLLHRRDKLTREQIAETVGISVGMVKKHLAQGLAVCRRFQSGRDET